MKMPCESKLEEYEKVISVQYPALLNTCFVADGMKVLNGCLGLFLT